MDFIWVEEVKGVGYRTQLEVLEMTYTSSSAKDRYLLEGDIEVTINTQQNSIPNLTISSKQFSSLLILSFITLCFIGSK